MTLTLDGFLAEELEAERLHRLNQKCNDCGEPCQPIVGQSYPPSYRIHLKTWCSSCQEYNLRSYLGSRQGRGGN